MDLHHPPNLTYVRPPLVEVAMSVQFDPPNGLNLAHLGAFWLEHKTLLPRVQAVQPISAKGESFGGKGQWLPPSLQFAITNEPDCRLQMTSDDEQWMYQIQRDRMVVNWRKRGEQYPRYNQTWGRFLEAWNVWIHLLRKLALDPPRPRLWELSYVNRIPKADLWNTPNDWPRIFPGLWGGSFCDMTGVELRGLRGQWVWESSRPPARLYLEPSPGRSNDQPPQDVLLLSLTARGPIELTATEGTAIVRTEFDMIEAGMGCGHAFIVTAFDSISSEAAKTKWGRQP